MPPKPDMEISANTEPRDFSDILPPTHPAAYDAWFRAKVQEALDDPRTGIPSEEVELHFAKRRAKTLREIEKNRE